jgi:putative transposase
MDEYESLSHTKWDCKHHVLFILKSRRKTLNVSFGVILGKCSGNSPRRRKAGSSRGI